MTTPLFSVESWITQYFGPSEFARETYTSGYHEGIDLVPIDRESWNIYSPIMGRVMWAGWGDTYGHNAIIWNRYKGYSFRFCHLESLAVVEGDIINTWTSIGVCGDSGKSQGRHLHLNMMPMKRYGTADFPGNGTGGRVDPLGALKVLGVHI